MLHYITLNHNKIILQKRKMNYYQVVFLHLLVVLDKVDKGDENSS